MKMNENAESCGTSSNPVRRLGGDRLNSGDETGECSALPSEVPTSAERPADEFADGAEAVGCLDAEAMTTCP